jgi:outer membrane protein assembly factor BamB
MKLIIYSGLLALIFNSCSSQNTQGHSFLDLNAVANTISYNRDNVIYSSWDTTVCIYSLDKQSKIFSLKTDDVCYSKPVERNGYLYFPFSENSFVCMRLRDKEIIWEVELKGRCSNFDFADDSTIIASADHYGLIVLNAARGSILYELRYDYSETNLPDLSPWPVSFDDSNFYVSNWQGTTLSSFKKHDGALNWQFTEESFGLAGKGVIFNHKVLIGTNEAYKGGKLTVLNARNGEVLHRQENKFEEKVVPITLGSSVYFYSYDGYLNRYDLENNNASPLLRLGKESDLSGNQLFLVDNEIIFSDASYFINRYSIAGNQKQRMVKTQGHLLGAFKYAGKIYLVN